MAARQRTNTMLLYVIILVSQIAPFQSFSENRTKYRRSMLLSQNQPISPIPTGPVLPGVSYFNKIYNMLDGTDLLEKPGRDIYTFRYSNAVQTWTSQYTYLVPVEFTGVPNIHPQCSKDTTLSIMKSTWSKAIITERNTAKKSGFSISLAAIGAILGPVINLIAPEVGTAISAITASDAFKDTSISMRKGNSRNSISARIKRGEGYTKTFSLNAETSLYEGRVAWDQLHDFSLKTEFVLAINILELSGTNLEILQFIERWGTHVLDSAKMGAMCQESVYVKSTNSAYDYSSFYQYTKTKKSGILFWSKSTTTTTTMAESGSYNSECYYEFTDIRCEGECYTTQPCGGMTGTGFWVKPIEYELIPIWTIEGLLSSALSEKFQLFVAKIMKALLECRVNHCNNRGICTLRADVYTSQFVFDWDGLTFDDMIDYSRDCYCEDGSVGNLCTGLPTPPPTARPTLRPTPKPIAYIPSLRPIYCDPRMPVSANINHRMLVAAQPDGLRYPCYDFYR